MAKINKNMTMRGALSRVSEIRARLAEMADTLENDSNREDFTEEEKMERDALKDEYTALREFVNNKQLAGLVDKDEEKPVSNAQAFREMLSNALHGGGKREVTLNVKAIGDKNNISSAGAQKLTINDIMPELNEGLVFDKVGMRVQTGVTGDIVWPYATDSVEFHEKGETESLADQKINFSNVKAVPADMGATIKISNDAIDEASFDLLGYVQKAISLAQARQLNWKTFSVGTGFTGIHGPFSNITSITSLDCTYAKILDAKAAMIAKGVDMSGFCYVMSPATEAKLKATPKAAGQGGFIIQDGKLDGDPYFVTHFMQVTRKDHDSTATKKYDRQNTASADNYLGLGAFAYFAANQHGQVRLTIDPLTLAGENMTKMTINTRWSLTTLRADAFAVYKLVDPSGD